MPELLDRFDGLGAIEYRGPETGDEWAPVPNHAELRANLRRGFWDSRTHVYRRALRALCNLEAGRTVYTRCRKGAYRVAARLSEF